MHTAGKEVIVRRLQAHEHAAYRTVRLECLRLNPDLFGTTYPEASAMPILPFERFISTGDRDNVMFGAFVDGWLCGLCGFARETRQRTRHRGELVQMYVHTTLTRRGVGGRLIGALQQWALEDPTIQQVVLSVMAENTAAVSTYWRAGFREYGRLDRAFRLEGGASRTQLLMVWERD